MKKAYLGIDIGTQSIRVVAFDISGNILAQASESQYMQTIKPGWATEKPKDWWDKIAKCCQQIFSVISPDCVYGVAVDGVTHSPVCIDKDGELLIEDVQLYCDKRPAEIVEYYKDHELADKLWDETRNWPTCNWMCFKARWIKDYQPDIYEKTRYFMSAKDYINYKLTGVVGYDYSEASATMLVNHETCEWSDFAFKCLELDKEKFPQIRKSSEILGTVTKSAAIVTGIKAGTPVVAGAGDMPSALYGAGLIREGTCVDIVGTGSVIAIYNKHAVKDKMLGNFRCATEGWSPYLSMDSSGGAYRWFRDVMCRTEIAEAEKKKISAFDLLNSLAKEISPGADGVFFMPYLQGERTRGSAYTKASFCGMTPNTSIGHLARAVMEGVSYESKASLDIIDRDNVVKRITITGGAAKGDTWSQIKADIYGKPVVTLVQKETATFGSALLAAVANGEYRDEIEASDATLKFEKEFEPDAKRHDRYMELFSIFNEIHDVMQSAYINLGKLC